MGMLGWSWNESARVLVNPLDRVVILIDGSSLFWAANHLAIEIDYERLLPCLLRGRPLLRAHFYTGFSPGNLKQASFLRWMRNHGYRVIQKELTVNADGTRYADMGVEIAIDMLQFSAADNQVNVLMLITQDVDLAYALEKITHTGVRMELLGVQAIMPQVLIGMADYFIDLELLKDEIRKMPVNDF
jgi:uncharacterized LabA/DUF88 family protein